MNLVWNGLALMFNIFVRRMTKGEALRIFCTKMGIAYIKFAQILAMQNIDNIFTEQDRKDIMSICDDCNPISWKHIHKILMDSYPVPYRTFVKKIYRKPLGSASVSQVHRAVLKDGREVVFKVKRQDIQGKVERSVKQIRFVVHKLGWIFKFSNRVGSERAFDYYIEWINKELNFSNEVNNIKRYSEFAESVNGKVSGCVDIVVPKVYDEYCTDNIICMEYIPYKTIFHLAPDDERIINAFNSYLKLSFYALWHDMPVVFHGDPHGGNVYIDDNGNIGFLDMGLIFELNKDERRDVSELFFLAYFRKADKLYRKLIPYLTGDRKAREEFRDAIEQYCIRLNTRPLTAFFMDMVVVCFGCSLSPPKYLFCMAKAFVCLGGVDVLYFQSITGHELLRDQVDEYIITELINAVKETNYGSVKILKAVIGRDKKQLAELIHGQYNSFKTLYDLMF